MNIDELKADIELIRGQADDPGSAHAAEDCVWEVVMQAIADGAPNAAELARLALTTKDIEFPRWFA